MSMIGKTLGNFTLETQIGKGGMGEVYKAKDQKLGRDVAIKVLPEEFARDADRVARFQREAKLLASLNHSNIGSIYGLEEADGTNFLVLELIEGDTFSDRLKHGAIPVEEALKLALQIAEALEAAHEKGVIHRDLKPANIKVTPDGKVKILDFGLAKAFAGDQAEVNLSNSPTLSLAATQQGIILGTAAYMSPEQASGEATDKRTDIWAFGVVLFEMLTGRSLFEGNNVSQTLASVIKSEPEWQTLPQNLHPRIKFLLERCLKKEPKNRYHDIADARVDIQEVLADPSGVFAQPVTIAKPKKTMRLGIPWIAAAVFVAVIITALAVWYLKPAEPHQVMRFDYKLPENQSFSRGGRSLVAVSADGTKIVYVANQQLYLRNLKELTARPIQGTAEDPSNPFFSPDGQWIGYWSAKDGQLKKITVDGGASVTLCDAGNPYGATWGEDDTILFGQEAGVMSVSANGGPAQLLVKIEERERIHGPQLLPGGEWVLFTIGSTVTGDIWDKGQIVVQSLESGERKVLVSGGSDARYLPTGHLAYALGDVLYAKAFNVGSLEVMGGAVPIVKDVQRAYGYTGAAQYGFSDTGTLAYVVGGADIAVERSLVWVDRNGKEETIDAPPRPYTYAHLSPDATQVALDIRDQENDIWIWDLARKTLARLTFDPANNYGGIWTPDGKSVAYSAVRNEENGIWLQPADGSGSPELLIKVPEGGFAEAFSPDGKQLLVTGGLITGGPTPIYISLISIGAGAEPKQLLASKYNEYNAQISPDGCWMVYQSDESGRFEIYVRPFPDVNAGRWQISTEGGTKPLWNKNGREIFYFLPPGIMMSVPVETGTSFKAGTPRVLFKGTYNSSYNRTQYSVTPDGRRFLMIKDAVAEPGSALPQQINIVLNWFEELKERVPLD